MITMNIKPLDYSQLDIIAIAGMDLNRGIGHRNKVPWKNQKDMKFFKETTMGHTVIMGRNTWLSLGKPLSGRKNFVISGSHLKLSGGAVQFSTIQQCLNACLELRLGKIFIIGGAKLYESAFELGVVNYIYLNKINDVYPADTFMPIFEDRYTMVSSLNFGDVLCETYLKNDLWI